MRIGIFADANNQEALQLLNLLSDQGKKVQPYFFDVNLPSNVPVSIDTNHLLWNGINTCELDSAFLFDFQYMNPVIPNQNDKLEWTVWQSDYLIDQQKYSFLCSFFAELSRRGVEVINTPQSILHSYLLPHLLEKLNNSSFRVPDFICTNDIDHVNAFCKSDSKFLWRPVTGRAPWQLFLEKQRDTYIKKDAPPVLIAEIKPGPLYRAYLYKGRPLTVLSFASPSLDPPERLEQFSIIDLPELNHIFNNFYSETQIQWALVYFIHYNNQCWIYDVDMSPLLYWLPDDLRITILKKIAGKLCQADEVKQNQLIPHKAFDRPTMFLRRMLRILFDFERIKYTT